jgi:Fic family protein
MNKMNAFNDVTRGERWRLRVLTTEHVLKLRNYPNSAYYDLKVEFLYHSNKVEGSAFTEEELDLLMDKRIVSGEHKLEDVIETVNSLALFEYMVDTLGDPVTKSLILDFHKILKKGTRAEAWDQVGKWKKVSNSLRNSEVVLAQPCEVDMRIDDLLNEWNNSSKGFEEIVNFHVKFEHMHPFLDGNGRVGRFVMLKQCLDNTVSPIVLDSEYEREYKTALGKAQLTGNQEDLQEVLKKCQLRFANRDIVKNTVEQLNQEASQKMHAFGKDDKN